MRSQLTWYIVGFFFGVCVPWTLSKNKLERVNFSDVNRSSAFGCNEIFPAELTNNDDDSSALIVISDTDKAVPKKAWEKV